MPGGDDRRILLWRSCELIEGKHRSVAMEVLHDSNIFSLAFSSNNAYAYSAGKLRFSSAGKKLNKKITP